MVWDLATGMPAGPAIRAHGGAAVTLAISPDGRMLATGGGDRTVQLWSLADRTPLGPPLVTGHKSNVVSLAFSLDGSLLATASWDGTVMVWDIATRRPRLPPLALSGGNQIESVAFSPDGRTLGAGGSSGAWIVAAATGQLRVPALAHPGGVKNVAFSRDGRLLATGGGAGTLLLWSVDKGEPVRPPLLGHQKWIESIVFTPDGNGLLSSSDDTTILWNETSIHRLARVRPGPTGSIDALAFDGPGSVLAAGGCRDGAGGDAARPPAEATKATHWTACRQAGIWLVQPSDGSDPAHARRRLSRHAAKPGVFGRDGQTLLAAGCAKVASSDCTGLVVETWRADGGRVSRNAIDAGGPLSTMAVSPRGRLVATATGVEIRLWDVETGRAVGSPLARNERASTASSLARTARCWRRPRSTTSSCGTSPAGARAAGRSRDT